MPEMWQAPRQSHPNFSVNFATGNVCFKFATTRFFHKGLEPSPSLDLAFNTMGIGKIGDYTAGFGLGSGWTASVGSRLDFPTATTAVLTRRDGSEIEFSFNGTSWQAEAGYFHTLEPKGGDWYVKDLGQKSYVFNASGNAIRIVGASGNTYSMTHSGGHISSATDPVGRLTSFVYSSGSKLEDIVDQYSNTWTLSYDSAGRFSGLDDPMYGSVSFTYDASGRIGTLTDLDSDTWIFDYFVSGPFTGRIKSITDPVGVVESFTYVVDLTSDKTIHTDTRGNSWRYVFDKHKSPALIRLRSPLAAVWHYDYSADRQLESATDPEGNTWDYTYDGLGHIETATDPEGVAATYTYDPIGNRKSASVGGDTVLYFFSDPAHPTRLTQMQEQADASGVRATTNFTYYSALDGIIPGTWNGQIATLTDAEGGQSRYIYNDLGQLSKIEEGPVGAAGGIEVRLDQGTSQVFTNLGGMEYPAHFPALPALPTQILGSMDQHIVDPYDLTWRGSTRSREVQVSVPITSASGLENSTLTKDFAYDHRGRAVTASETSNETFAHAASPPAIPAVRAFSITFDDAAGDGLTTTTTPDGDVVETLRNSEGRATSYTITAPDGKQLQSTYTYTSSGRLETDTRSDLSAIAYTYLDNGMIDTIVHKRGLVTTLSIQHWYNNKGLLETATEATPLGSVVKSFTYDSRDQLILETYAPSPIGAIEQRIYDYDLVGNRTDYTLISNGLTVERSEYHYDLEDPSVYKSSNNRLTWIETFDGADVLLKTTWFFYENEFGHSSRVVSKDAGSTTLDGTAFLFDDVGQPWLTWGEAWTESVLGPINYTRSHVVETRQDGSRQRLWRTRDSQTLQPVGETEWVTRLGDLAAAFNVKQSDASAEGVHLDIDGYACFSPFGDETFGQGRLGTVRLRATRRDTVEQDFTAFGSALTADAGTDYGFAGGFGVRSAMESSPLSDGKLISMGYRFYSPEVGRFLMRDPLGAAGGIGLYTFVGNTPTAFVDPKGLAKEGAQSGEPHTVINYPDPREIPEGFRVNGRWFFPGDGPGLPEARIISPGDPEFVGPVLPPPPPMPSAPGAPGYLWPVPHDNM